MNKKTLFSIIGGITLIVIGVLIFKPRNLKPTEVITNNKPDLPVNTIPITERPFMTLTPDASGRNLNFLTNHLTAKSLLEYELVYDTGELQEGAFGRIDFTTEKQPATKTILLGTRSAGGATTYHEGVTGGSLTVTYNETKLEERFAFLRFDTSVTKYESLDAQFALTLGAKSLKKNDVIILMKTFGLPATLPAQTAKLLAGPYFYGTAMSPKTPISVAIKMPAREHANPTIYEWSGVEWKKLATKLSGDTVRATATTGSTFVVTEE